MNSQLQQHHWEDFSPPFSSVSTLDHLSFIHHLEPNLQLSMRMDYGTCWLRSWNAQLPAAGSSCWKTPLIRSGGDSRARKSVRTKHKTSLASLKPRWAAHLANRWEPSHQGAGEASLLLEVWAIEGYFSSRFCPSTLPKATRSLPSLLL